MCCPCPQRPRPAGPGGPGRPAAEGNFAVGRQLRPAGQRIAEYLRLSGPAHEPAHRQLAGGDVNGSQLRPSFVVQRMEKLFPRLRVTREDGSYRRRLPATALELAGEDPALRQYFRGRGDYDRVLDAMDRGRALGRGRLSGPAVEALYGRSCICPPPGWTR